MAKRPLNEHVSKKIYEARLPRLREELVQLQVQLKESGFSVVLVLAGVEGAGRGDVINTLSGWLDPRGVETIAFNSPTDEERERPWMWRFWRTLPSAGRIGIYAESWYTEAFRREAQGDRAEEHFESELANIRHFEKLLSADGTLVVKVWLHLSKSDQGDRLRELEEDEDTAWRVTPEHWKQHRHYDRLNRFAEELRARTNQSDARWTEIDAAHERSRDLAVAELLLERFRAHLARMKATRRRKRTSAKVRPLRASGLRRLRKLPLDQSLSDNEYDVRREKWLGKLHRLTQEAFQSKRSIVFVFEGWDAAGKGGAIRRLTSAIDARDFRVIPVAKPTDEEKAHHYLWRFWRNIPRDGIAAIFDRSWYGRILVERVENFARPDEWQRAYSEINDFESQLTEHGTIVVKLWLQITKEEQLQRFRAREKTPYKRHKINDEDWRNRGKWDAYEVAVGDMLALTERGARWHIIPANDKRFARLEVLKVACSEIERALSDQI